MAQLIVRNIDAHIAEALKRRAAANGRSAEAEHREILRQVLADDQQFKTLLAAMPDAGADSDFDRFQDRGRPVDL